MQQQQQQGFRFLQIFKQSSIFLNWIRQQTAQKNIEILVKDHHRRRRKLLGGKMQFRFFV